MIHPIRRHVRLTAGLFPAMLILLVSGCDPSAFPSFAPAAATTQPYSVPTSLPAEMLIPTTPDNDDALVAEIIRSVNGEREKLGLAPLTRSAELCRLADQHAERMIAGDFFSHTDPFSGANLAARARKRGYAFFKVGENLGAIQRDPADVMKDWMESPSHRANILDPDFTEIGVSVRDGGRYGRYWVQEFGRPLGQ